MELIVHEIFEEFTTKFYLRKENGRHIEIYGFDGKDIVCQTLKEGERTTLQPLISCPSSMTDTIIAAFTNIAKNRHIETEKESHIKGRLESTEKHLEDMREIVKHLIFNYKNNE